MGSVASTTGTACQPHCRRTNRKVTSSTQYRAMASSEAAALSQMVLTVIAMAIVIMEIAQDRKITHQLA